MNLESELIGTSKAIQTLREAVLRVSKKSSHVTITGDRGVGKTDVARLIHEASGARGSMVTLNPSTMTDSEIKEILGNLTPSVSTLLIQGVGEFSFVHQAAMRKALLRLQAKPSTRVIITTQGKISDLARERKLFEDLHEILKSFDVIAVPRLSDRTEDIPLLVEHFIKNACDAIGARLKVIDTNTLDILMRKDWKENITELKSLIEKAVFASNSEIVQLSERLVDEATQVRSIIERISDKKTFSFDKSFSNLEKTFIERALEVAGGNQTRAAALLNLSEANFRHRLRKYNIISARKK
jgi:DNA-binding NtrC family response regulator